MTSLVLAALVVGGGVGPLGDSQQAVVVVSPSWDATSGKLYRFSRRPNGAWKQVGRARVVLGKSGMAWGRGLHPMQDGKQKAEGDKRAPAGVFSIGAAMGYHRKSLGGMRWPYESSDPGDVCVDDRVSRHYNRVVDSNARKDWRSAETMLRADPLYRWVLLLNHNTNPPIRGSGSCIFAHVWRAAGSPTLGCTAMALQDLTSLLTWLDPDANPVWVQLPRKEYDRLSGPWALPRLP